MKERKKERKANTNKPWFTNSIWRRNNLLITFLFLKHVKHVMQMCKSRGTSKHYIVTNIWIRGTSCWFNNNRNTHVFKFLFFSFLFYSILFYSFLFFSFLLYINYCDLIYKYKYINITVTINQVLLNLWLAYRIVITGKKPLDSKTSFGSVFYSFRFSSPHTGCSCTRLGHS